MINLKLLLFLGLFLVAVTVVQAADIEVQHSAVHNSIIEGERAAFHVNITNNQNFKDSFRFSTTDIFWAITSDPLHHYFSGVDIASGDTKTVQLMLRPDADLELGQYRIDVTVEAEKSKIKEKIPLFVKTRSADPLIRDYFAAVNRFVEIPPVVDPREDVVVRINLVNRNPKDLEELTIKFSSNLLNREINTSLGPLESTVVEEAFTLDPLTEPQNDTLTVEIIFDGSVLSPTINEDFSVGSYSEITQESENVSEAFLKSTIEKTYRNTGNVNASKTVEFESGLIETYFTKSNPKAFEVKREGKRYLAWDISLGPGETITVTRTVSYYPLVWIALLAAAAFALYYIFRSPLTVTKRASIVHMKDTGISELKIYINLRNRSDKTYEKATIRDAIPMLADVSGGTDAGTLKPSSVYNDGSKTIVKWELKRVDPAEERVLSYSIKTRLAILGSVELSPVVMRFHTKSGTKMVTRSNSVKVEI